ncbi:MAG: hypothetical protein J6K21_05705 [Bacilli bacterium]|nr:hypothetical protein [Bacilli bacterium]
MEFLIELVIDLVLEGSLEVSKNKKISKFIRYPLIAIIILFFAIVIFGLMFIGIICLKNSIVGGLIILLFSILLLIMAILKFKKIYLEKRVNEK